jgi:hypothetical protein
MLAPGTLSHGPGFTPVSVHHATEDLHWMVWRILDHWETSLNASERLATGAIVERWRLEVSGPLPGRPGKHGRFVMLAETRGNEPGWLLSPVTP